MYCSVVNILMNAVPTVVAIVSVADCFVRDIPVILRKLRVLLLMFLTSTLVGYAMLTCINCVNMCIRKSVASAELY